MTDDTINAVVKLFALDKANLGMELYNAKIFVIAKLEIYGLTIGKTYKVLGSYQHFDDKCLRIIDDNGCLKDYNIGCFECE